MKWLVMCSLIAARLMPNESNVVQASGGLLQGEVARDGSHMAFYGVPYATVETRFQESRPDPKWEGIKKANDENIKCTQRFMSDFIVGQEDCLTLNVYVPLPHAEQLRPVMVFIHGGGFRDGSGSPFIYGPDFLIKHDVILVTINYRVEILGFLCLGIKEAPGNVGLKDQVEALRWVKRNIMSFGGDPNNVTIFGESAGSSSVMYHLLSPMSEGLFHKAIMQSGSALGHWAFQFEPLEIAHKFAEQLHADTDDLRELVTILRNKSDRDLLRTRVPRKIGDSVQSENIFVPCLEKEIPGIERFLPDYPYNLISKGKYNKVPIIIGFNNEEGYYFAGKENDTTINNLNFYASLPRNLIFPSEKKKREIADDFKALYVPNQKISRKTLDKVARFDGEMGIVFPAVSSIDLFSRTSDQPIFAYKFTHSGWLNIPKILSGFRNYPGATHADELGYIFSNKLQGLVPKKDRDIIEKMTTMWTNFAKYGHPVPVTSALLPQRWPPISQESPRLFVIDNEFDTEPLWGNRRLLFWNQTYQKYRRLR